MAPTFPIPFDFASHLLDAIHGIGRFAAYIFNGFNDFPGFEILDKAGHDHGVLLITIYHKGAIHDIDGAG